MRRTAVRLVLPLLVGLLGSASPGQAQLGGWSVSATADFGGVIPLRQLGKNAGTIPQIPILQVVAERKFSGAFGGGVTFASPTGTTLVRARYSTTLGGIASGRLGVCGDPDEPFFQGPLCEPVEVDSDVQSFQVDVGFLQGSTTALVRPSIHLGAGMRSYSFGTNDCVDPTEWETICEFTSEIWQNDGGITPFIMAGLRLTSSIGPADLWLEAMDHVGRYQGGSDRADGNLQNDLALTGGFSLKVF